MPDGPKDQKCRGTARLFSRKSMTGHDRKYDGAKNPVDTVRVTKVNLRVSADRDPGVDTCTARRTSIKPCFLCNSIHYQNTRRWDEGMMG